DAQRYAEEIRQVTPLAQALLQFADHLRAAQAYVEPARQALELFSVMFAGLHELLWPLRHQPAVYVAVPAATASATAPPVSVVASDTFLMTETADVQKGSPSDPGMPLDAKTVFLAVLWVFTILLPLKDGLLPPEVQNKVWEFITIVNFTLTIHWRVSDSRKRDD